MTRLEVLEERLLLTAGSNGTVASQLTIGDEINGGPALSFGDLFGGSVTSIGDLNGDGIGDLAVGAPLDDTNGASRGAVYIALMNADGTVQSTTKIASGLNGGPTLRDGGQFGSSVAMIGDLNGDGVVDLAVGSAKYDTDGRERGAVYILFLNENGTVQSSTRIASGENGGPKLKLLEHFGQSVAALGDLNGDGVADLAVGAPGQDAGNEPGGVYILFMKSDGSVRSVSAISGKKFDLGNSHALAFGTSITALGDMDGDGVTELAVGAPKDTFHGPASGTVSILFLNARGKVKTWTSIGDSLNLGPDLERNDNFGVSVASVGDLDGDGFNELAVGALNDSSEGTDRGAIYIFRLVTNGIVRSFTKIASGVNGGPSLSDGDHFGISIAPIGDLNGDGITELAVGARDNNSIHGMNGALHVLFLNATSERPTASLNGGSVNYNGVSQPISVVPNVTIDDADTDPLLQIPGGKIVISFDQAANKKGTKVYDKLNLDSLAGVVSGAGASAQVLNGRLYISYPIKASATVTQIETALRGITFETTKAGFKQATRTIDLQVVDRAGNYSNLVRQTINLKKS